MFRAICLATVIWMITVTGAMNLNTVTSGIRAKLGPAGLLTAMATGTGSTRGAGLGSTIRLGALLPSIMAAGVISRAGGAGARVRSLVLRSLGRLSLASSAADLDSVS